MCKWCIILVACRGSLRRLCPTVILSLLSNIHLVHFVQSFQSFCSSYCRPRRSWRVGAAVLSNSTVASRELRLWLRVDSPYRCSTDGTGEMDANEGKLEGILGRLDWNSRPNEGRKGSNSKNYKKIIDPVARGLRLVDRMTAGRKHERRRIE